ncbi:hypothetical protein IV203_000174 [Nitzschia inconspicua]|uniref:Uncharacterized protein n=1 Tax=Nitzschia inconspicua TaxID=303405 RepID=A0A9K3L6E3_9STRA|nr:hypothetical protein IV203_000174 [Nitzschia inconspicua]
MTDTASAREEVMKCEQEIHSIKAALRRVGTTSSSPDAEQNSMEIVLLKVDGLPAGAKPSIKLQLSSPIEEATLDTLYDPLNSDPDVTPEGSIVVFRGVEPAVATLTLSAKDADIPLGSSTPHEVAPLCALDPMQIKDKYVTELPIAIVAQETLTAASVNVSDEPSAGTEESAQEAQAEEAVAIQPTCTVTLRITYKPSPKDQREELYELLNKTSQRKATALENLRKISMQAASNRSQESSSAGTITKPSVKPGFLNKQKENEESKLKKLYDRAFGPDSLLRGGALMAYTAKDFFIFFGAVAFFHFKGQLLAIPPPV